mgnify:CR=1 FL=1
MSAEVGQNHNGKLKFAYRLVDVAKRCGADFVKFQTSIPELHISKFAKKANYQIKNWKKKENTELWTQLDNVELTKQLKLEWEWVKAHAGNKGNESVDKKANQKARMTHISKSNELNMVDVSNKNETIRIAKATFQLCKKPTIKRSKIIKL